MKRKSRKGGKVTRGTSSAVLISVLIHAGLFLLAGLLVVFTVEVMKEPEFEAPKAVERPKMKLKKPKVRPKKSSKPKTPNRISAIKGKAALPEIDMPSLGGMGDGLEEGFGLDIAFEPGEITVMGSDQSIGNDLEGTLYDFKRRSDGRDQEISHEEFQAKMHEFLSKGWDESVLHRFYQSPKKLYATHFIVPPIISQVAADYFNQEEMACYFFFIKYKGKLVYKEDIKFRFWGVGDAYVAVQVDGKDVFANGWDHTFYNNLGHWLSSSPMSDRYYFGNQLMKVGDWIELKAGEPVDMQILFGECHAGEVTCGLLVEEYGKEYPTSDQGGPLLPAFKTEEFTLEMIEDIYSLLPEGECSLTNGPIFRDF